jgi:integrase
LSSAIRFTGFAIIVSLPEGATARCVASSQRTAFPSGTARHTYGTYTMRATGNTFAVMKQMGHASLRSMEPYQHQEIDQLLDAVNQRNTDRTTPQIAAA